MMLRTVIVGRHCCSDEGFQEVWVKKDGDERIQIGVGLCCGAGQCKRTFAA